MAVYLVVLFAVAFLLLLMAYFQQQRTSAEATSDALKQSASAVQSIQNLMGENEELRQENEALKKQLDEALSQLDSLPDIISHQEHVLEQTQIAMDYFWQLDEAYVRGRYGLCRDLIDALEDSSSGQTPLKDYLPTESATDTDRFSPAERYQEIYKALY